MIRCIDVRKIYRQGESEIAALDGISLDIRKGAFAVIMGPSGSGKSTLLHLIGGLDRPTGGDLLVDGRLIGQMADDEVTLFRRTKIGFVFQFFNLLPTLTALENVALPLVLSKRQWKLVTTCQAPSKSMQLHVRVPSPSRLHPSALNMEL